VSNDVSLGRQTLRREINERISNVIDWRDSPTIDVFCECGGRRCSIRLKIPGEEFRAVREARGQFVVASGHEHLVAEQVVAGSDGYVIVDRSGR
jgi:hypothetical protein